MSRFLSALIANGFCCSKLCQSAKGSLQAAAPEAGSVIYSAELSRVSRRETDKQEGGGKDEVCSL